MSDEEPKEVEPNVSTEEELEELQPNDTFKSDIDDYIDMVNHLIVDLDGEHK